MAPEVVSVVFTEGGIKCRPFYLGKQSIFCMGLINTDGIKRCPHRQALQMQRNRLYNGALSVKSHCADTALQIQSAFIPLKAHEGGRDEMREGFC